LRLYLQNHRWVIRWAAFIFGVTLIPYLLGFGIQGENWKFAGFVFGVGDGNSYIAKMLNGAQGDWLFRTPYTNIEQPGILSFIPYLLLGKLASSPGSHEQLTALFQIFRFAGVMLYCLAAYDFLCVFTKNEKLIKWGVILCSIGGGLGWMTIFGLKGSGYNGLPIDLYSPETFGFLSLLGLPHLAVSRALLVWGWCLFLTNDSNQNSLKRGVLIGGLWLLLGFFQPLSILTAWAGLGSAWLVLWIFEMLNQKKYINPWKTPSTNRWFKQALVACAISSFWVIYNLIAMSTDPFLKGWTAQNIILSPAILDYVIGFCLLLIPAGLGLVVLLRSKLQQGSLLVGFLALFPLLAYFPINLQRRLPDGIWWVLVVLTVLGLEQMRGRLKKLVLGFGYAGILTSLFILIGGIFSTQTLSQPTFVPIDKIMAFKAIEKDWTNTTKPIVLADFAISNNLPAWIPVNVIVGHGPESVNLKENLPIIDRILEETNPDKTTFRFLQSNTVDYIIFEKKSISNDWLKISSVIFHQNETWVLRLIEK
jgi:hypothetical protein